METATASKMHGLESKTSAQKWSNNVQTLSLDIKKQTNLLGNLNSHKDDGTGNAGEGSIRIDYFDLIYDRLIKEIEMYMASSQMLMQISG